MKEPRDDSRAQQIKARAQAVGVRVQLVPAATLDKLANNGVHQGVAAAIRPLPLWNEDRLVSAVDAAAASDLAAAGHSRKPPFLLVLDGVTDPHNLGACMRSAEAAGVDAVVVPKDRSATLDGTVRKVAAGAAEFVPFAAATNLARTLDELKKRNVWVVGLDDAAKQTLYSIDLTGPLALVLGAEGEGMRRLTKERCDHLAHIPMSGKVSSLNVSVAAGVAMFEAIRQRQYR